MRHDIWLRGLLHAAFAACALLVPCHGEAAQPTVHKVAPNIAVSSLAGKADSDIVEFPNGRQVSVGSLRRLEAAAPKLRESKANRMPAALKVKPAATGIPVKNAADLSAALKRPDNTTVQLPSGQRVTVGQIKFAQPIIERRLGRKLDTIGQRPDLSGPAVKITNSTTKAEWTEILQRPANTVLESPNGTRVTVGEMREGLKRWQGAHGRVGAARTPSRPAATSPAQPTIRRPQ